MSFLTLRPFISAPCYRILNSRMLTSNLFQCRLNSTQPNNSKSLAEAKASSQVSADVKPLGERVKENTKTVSYMGVIAIGIGVTGIMFYAIFNELFSSSSPNTVYSEALDYCINDTRVQDSLGAPIKGFGEETKRRRRNHVAHSVYMKNGVEHMRMVFYIQGIRNKATVNLEMRRVNILFPYFNNTIKNN